MSQITIKPNYEAMNKLKELQKEDDDKFVSKIKADFGIGQDFNKELEGLICETYHVYNIINLFRESNLTLKPLNLSYAISTYKKYVTFDVENGPNGKGKNNSLNCLMKIIDYFSPRWIYLKETDKQDKPVKLCVDWMKYVQDYFHKYPFETFPAFGNGIEYKSVFGAWKILNAGELSNTFNKGLIKTLNKWSLNQSSIINYGIRQTSTLIKALTLNRKVDIPEGLLSDHLVAFRNGTYNFNTNKLQSHNKDNYLLNLHRYDVDLRNTQAPNTDKLLNDMMGSSDTFFKEFIGYCFYPNHSVFQDFIILNGEGGEGKSTLLNYIRNDLFGATNVSALDPQTMADRNNRFATSDLYGKELNVVPDISDKLIKDIDVIKGLVGGDAIRAEIKGKQAFSFVSRAKNIWSANKLPTLRSSDINRALADRANVIKLINGDTRQQSNHFWQTHDMDKVKSERPQFVGECLTLFHEVLIRHNKGMGKDSWSKNQAIKVSTEAWLKHNDPVGEWLESVREETPSLLQGGFFIKDDAFFDYKWWCDHEGRTPLNKNNLGEALCLRYGFENKRVHLNNGAFPYCWVNHNLKKEWDGENINWSKKRPIKLNLN